MRDTGLIRTPRPLRGRSHGGTHVSRTLQGMPQLPQRRKTDSSCYAGIHSAGNRRLRTGRRERVAAVDQDRRRPHESTACALLQRLNHPRAERNTGETDVVESLTKPDRGSPLVRDSPEPPAAPHPHRRSSTLSALLLLALALNSRFGWSWTYSTADLVIAAAAIRQRKSKPGARTPANPNQPHPTHHRQVADAAGLFATPPHLTDRVRDCRGQCWKPPNGDPRNHIATHRHLARTPLHHRHRRKHTGPPPSSVGDSHPRQ